MSKARINKIKRYVIPAEAEAWLVDEAISTGLSVPDVIARLVKKERDRRGGGPITKPLAELSDFYAVSEIPQYETGS